MIHFFLIFLLSFAPYETFANSRKSLKQGDQAAKEFLDKVDEKKAEAGPHPFYKGKKPKEANLKAKALEGSSKSLIGNDPASQMVRESHEERPEFKMDVKHDPLITRAEKIGEDPLKAIGGEGTQLVEVQQAGTNERLTCEEAGEDSLETCVNTLIVKVKKTKVSKDWKGPIYFWRSHDAAKYGFSVACGTLRHDVFTAKRRGSGNITASYKACLQEIGNKESRRSKLNKKYKTRGSVRVPRLNIDPSQIKEVTIKPLPITRGRDGKPKIQGYSLHCAWDNHWDGDGYNCQASIKIVYEEDSYEILPDEEVSTCDRLEQRADLGLCSYGSKVCTQGHETRDIEGIPITRDCWQYT